MSEEEVPLAVGAVYGLRAWKVGSQGTLLPVTHPEAGAWVPGKNTAKCMNLMHEEPEEPRPPIAPTNPMLLTDDERSAKLHSLGRSQRFDQPDVYSIRVTGHDALYNVNSYSFLDISVGDRLTTSMITTRTDPDSMRLLMEDYEQQIERYPAHERLYQAKHTLWEFAMRDHAKRVENHLVPSEDCECGFYLANELDIVDTMLGGHSDNYLGIVKGYGRTASYANGWRVEHAEVVALAPYRIEKTCLRDEPPVVGGSGWVRYALGISEHGHTVERVHAPHHEGVAVHYPGVTHHATWESLLAEWLPKIGPA